MKNTKLKFKTYWVMPLVPFALTIFITGVVLNGPFRRVRAGSTEATIYIVTAIIAAYTFFALCKVKLNMLRKDLYKQKIRDVTFINKVVFFEMFTVGYFLCMVVSAVFFLYQGLSGWELWANIGYTTIVYPLSIALASVLDTKPHERKGFIPPRPMVFTQATVENQVLTERPDLKNILASIYGINDLDFFYTCCFILGYTNYEVAEYRKVETNTVAKARAKLKKLYGHVDFKELVTDLSL